MSNHVNVSPRDVSILRLLSWSPLTTAVLLRASCSFVGEPFVDERRLRERLQALAEGGLVRSWPAALGSGGLMNYYKLTPAGFTRLYGPDAPLPSRAFFSEVSPSLFSHTFHLAEAICEIVRSCHLRRITIERFIRENELTLTAGNDQVLPDCFFRLSAAGKSFSLAFEIDESTESLDSFATTSVRKKLVTYHAYQDLVLSQWILQGKKWTRPRLRVVFLTRTMERAYHILSLAMETNRNPARRLVYASTHDTFVSDPQPLESPIFLDHKGGWQALIDLHPTTPFRKAPVRLKPSLAFPLLVR